MSDRQIPSNHYFRTCPFCKLGFTTPSSARICCGSAECDKNSRAERNARYRKGYRDGVPNAKLARVRKIKASKHSRDYRERKKREDRRLPIELPNDKALRKPPVREQGENNQDANAA